jgi:hypothetical protein
MKRLVVVLLLILTCNLYAQSDENPFVGLNIIYLVNTSSVNNPPTYIINSTLQNVGLTRTQAMVVAREYSQNGFSRFDKYIPSHMILSVNFIQPCFNWNDCPIPNNQNQSQKRQ